VEHPVTEMITKVNLPATQLQIAMGIPLHNIPDIRALYGRDRFQPSPSASSSDISFGVEERIPAHGHCIAVRITAENAEQGFKPTSGGIQELNFRSTPDVWGYFSMDSSGSVHEFADSQFGHLFANGIDREQARKNMVLALKELSIRGDIYTTVDYISNLIQMDDFTENRIDTGWLDKLIKLNLDGAEDTEKKIEKQSSQLYVVIAASIVAYEKCNEGEAQFIDSLSKGQLPSQSLLKQIHQVELIYESIKYVLLTARRGENSFTITNNSSTNDYVETSVRSLSDGGYLIKIHNKSHVAYVTSPRDSPSGMRLNIAGANVVFTPDYDPTTLRTDVAGKLVKRLVEEGSHVGKNGEFAEIEVMKMFMPLKVSESGKISWVANEGASLSPGQVIAKFELDNPEMVKTATVFDGTLASSFKEHRASFLSDNTEKPVRAHVLLRQSVVKLKEIMGGFVFPPDALNALLEDLQSAVLDKMLPAYEVEEQLSIISSRINLTLANKIKSIVESSKDGGNSNDHFNAQQIIDLMEHHAQSLTLSEQSTFLTTTMALRDCLTPYAKSTGGGEKALIELLSLLREWISIERNFCDANDYASAIDSLRKLHVNEPETVMKVCRAHSQLKETSSLVLLLIDIIGEAAISAKQTPPSPSPSAQSLSPHPPPPPSPLKTTGARKSSIVEGAYSLFTALPCLSEIGNMNSTNDETYNRIAARARKIIMLETSPSVNQRIEKIALLTKNATDASIKQFVETENVPINDIFLTLLSLLTDEADKKNLLNLYTRMVYRTYLVSDFKYDAALQAAVFTFRNSSDESSAISIGQKAGGNSMNDLTSMVSSNSINSDSESEGVLGIGAESGTKNRIPFDTQRFGLFAEVESIGSLQGRAGEKKLLGLIEKFPQIAEKKPRNLCGPVNTLHVAITQNEGGNLEEASGSLLDILQQNSITERLLKADVRRVSFILRGDGQSEDGGDEHPSIFTYRARLGYQEDTLFRHIEPALAYHLDLDRISPNFHVHPLKVSQTRTSNVHVYRAVPRKSAMMKSPAAKKVPRIFVRSLSFVSEYSKSMFERTFVDALNALDQSGNIVTTNSDSNNHLFINLLTEARTVTKDPALIEEYFSKVFDLYSDRLKKLNVGEIEIKASCVLNESSPIIRLRIISSNPTGFFREISTYVEAAEEETGGVVFRYIGAEKNTGFKGSGRDTLSWEGASISSSYPLTRPFSLKRSQALRSSDTPYVYDIPALFSYGASNSWDSWTTLQGSGVKTGRTPPKSTPSSNKFNCVNANELVVVRKNGESGGWTMQDYLEGALTVVETKRNPGENTIGMVAWLMTLKTPEYPQGRQIVVIANDITFKAGSFGTREDILFKLASAFARSRGLPRIYCAANSGARIGMSESVKKVFKVAFSDPEKPENGFEYLYLDSDEYTKLSKKGGVRCVLADGGEHRITDIIGEEEDLGVENLKGSGLIAGETSLAYDKIFTLTIVLGRSVGIGAYLVRLGQRTIQKQTSSPIILTGYQALNKLMGCDVYMTNDQLGGPGIMYPNGVSHLLANNHLEAITMGIDWLSFVPAVRGGIIPIQDIRGIDVIERNIDWTPVEGKPYDPRLLLTGAFGDDNDKKWTSGLLDKGSWKETLGGWAKTVVVGRGRLGGIPLGLILTENRTSQHVHPADPADKTSSESITSQAGGVWFPDSAAKTAQAIRDFGGEDLPLMIVANWRGFSGGQRDMFDEVLKFGALIVDALVAYTQPVFVYIPPFAELRGGAWVVVDATINKEVMEFYAAKGSARGGVLEPVGAAAIKFKKKDIIETMHRLDDELKALAKEHRQCLSTDPDKAEDLGEKIAYRENLLLPVYEQLSVTFADLHDTPGRMKAKGVIRGEVEWREARRYFYWRLRRRLAEFDLRRKVEGEVGDEGSDMNCGGLGTADGATESASGSAKSKIIEAWFKESIGSEGTGPAGEAAWDDDKRVLRWMKSDKGEIDRRLRTRKLQTSTAKVKNLLNDLKGLNLTDEEKAEFKRMIMDEL